jgi:hypothetical protein
LVRSLSVTVKESSWFVPVYRISEYSKLVEAVKALTGVRNLEVEIVRTRTRSQEVEEMVGWRDFLRSLRLLRSLRRVSVELRRVESLYRCLFFIHETEEHLFCGGRRRWSVRRGRVLIPGWKWVERWYWGKR